jgi:anti-anti-sigma regulatory factor
MEDQDILVVRVEEALYFGNTGQLKERLRRAEAYGGWLHIHPSEDEQRPATNDGTGTQPADRKTTRSFDRQPINSSPTNSMGRSAIALPSRTPNHVAYSGNDGGNESDALLQRFQSYRPPDLRAVVFDIENMTAIDASAIQILTEIVEDYQRRDIQVFFVKIREVNKSMFLRSGLLGEVLGSDHFFRKISEAIAYLRTINNRHPLQPADGETSSPDGRQSYSTYNVL